MIHLRTLPGAPGYGGRLDAVRESALADASRLAEGGVREVMIENFGDKPFYKDALPAETIASMAVIADAVVRETGLSIGINCLRNDALAALAIAAATGAAFVRVNVLTGARVTDQGVIEGRAAEVAREKARLRLDHVQVLADVDVKHSVPLAPRPLEEEVWDTVERGGASALIVSGTGTGRPTDPRTARLVRAAAPQTPIYIGSGATLDSIADFADLVDGYIVGTHFKHDGRVDANVDVDRVRKFVEAVARLA